MQRIGTWSFEPGTRAILAAGRWLPLRAVLWTIVLAGGVMALFLSTQYLGSWFHLPPNSAYAIVLGIPVLTFVLYALVVRSAEQRLPLEVLPDGGAVIDLLIGAAMGFVMLCTITTMLWAFGLHQVKPSHHWQHAFDSFVFNSYFSGMMEELLFRAILLRILARAFGARWGLVLSAVLFGPAHLNHGSWLPILEITINAGLPLGLLYMVTGRLWMAIGLHTAWDFTEDSLLGVNSHNGLLLATPMHGKPALLTGGAYGPDGSLLAMIVGLLTCAAILWASSEGLFQKKAR